VIGLQGWLYGYDRPKIRPQERRHLIASLSAWSSVTPSPHVHRAAVAQGKVHQVAKLFPILFRFWCVFVISTSLLFGFLHLLRLSSNPSFESPIGISLLVAKVSAVDATCNSPPPFCSLILVGGIRRS
jgi:hypothetical protein